MGLRERGNRLQAVVVGGEGGSGNTAEVLITRFRDNQKSMAVSHARLLNQTSLSSGRCYITEHVNILSTLFSPL